METIIYNNDEDLIHECSGSLSSAACVEAALAQNKSLNYAILSFMDLSGLNAKQGQFRWAWFNMANLSRSNFEKADLRSAWMSGTNLSFARLDDALLSDASIIDADCVDVSMNGASAVFADMRGSNFMRAKFKDSNLSFAHLHDSSFCQADFTGADLTGTKMLNAEFGEANFSRAKLSRAELRGVKLTPKQLREADFSEAKRDFFEIMARYPKAVDEVRKIIVDGLIDEFDFALSKDGICGPNGGRSLGATIAGVYGGRLDDPEFESLKNSALLNVSSAIKLGQKLNKSPVSALILGWLDSFVVAL